VFEHFELPSTDDRRIWDIFLSFNIYPAVCAADELGIFPILDEHGPQTTEDVAVRLGLTHDWSEALLGVLATQDLVRAQDGRFHLTDVARTYLLPDGEFYKGPLLKALRDDSRIDRTIGAARGENPRAEQWGERQWNDPTRRAQTMHSVSFPSALGMAKNGDFRGVTRLLDVAGGSGGFAIALALRYPEMRCSVGELPLMCEVADRFIAEWGVEDRVDSVELDMFEAWPEGYDAALMSNTLHDWDDDRRMQLLRRGFNALPAGGRMYIHEMMMGDAADGPPGPALFNFGMLLGTGGKQFTAPEMRGYLEAAGFRDVTMQNTYGYYTLMVGRKP
jgi:acetylserotonin N-methyltransferase